MSTVHRRRHAVTTTREQADAAFFAHTRAAICDLLDIPVPVVTFTRPRRDGTLEPILVATSDDPDARELEVPLFDENTDATLFALAFGCRTVWQRANGYRGQSTRDATEWAKSFLAWAKGTGPEP